MIHRLRHMYRKLLLSFIPARSYVIEVGEAPHEIIRKLQDIIQPHPFYFLFPARSQKPYSGKFSVNRFVAIKNNAGNFQRQIKVSGYFYIINNRIYVRIILSNPFSLINMVVLGFLYFLFLIFRVAPFDQFLLNALLWVLPVIITYLITNFTFQGIYKKEKLRFFKIFNGKRLTDKQIEALHI
ncbi:MAG: hypothetical protein IAE67_09575 [Candidatus Competibacteraceae bacterium]|nr:hypothetical protein [Candidatus Competibacteraceae bacterium]